LQNQELIHIQLFGSESLILPFYAKLHLTTIELLLDAFFCSIGLGKELELLFFHRDHYGNVNLVDLVEEFLYLPS
jgi:hypothetical protein